jgi:hypothetical protein
MSNPVNRFGFVLSCLVAMAVGCSKEVPPAVPSAGTTEEEPAALPPSDAPDAGATDPAIMPPPADDATGNAAPLEESAAPATGDQSEAEMIKASFASLSLEDREAATKQKVCPVGGVLGTMGTPIKVSVAGHDVFICCEHCEEALKAEPAKYLAKIGLEPAEEAAAQ